MSLSLLSGPASNISLGWGSSLSSNPADPSRPTRLPPLRPHLISLRIADAPVLFRTRARPIIRDGDLIAAAGRLNRGTLEALALTNLTTNHLYAPSRLATLLPAALLPAIGVPLLLIARHTVFSIALLLLLPLAALFLLRALRIRTAAARLQHAHGLAPPPDRAESHTRAA